MVDKTIHSELLTDYALGLVEDGKVSADHLLLCALKAMAPDDVRLMLDNNELTPRFFEADLHTYSVLFSGRQDGAIGKFSRITATVHAESIDSGSIIAALREQHGYETEHLVCRTLVEHA